MAGLLDVLRGKVSDDVAILTPSDAGFAPALARWSNIDHERPAIVAKPMTERDVSILVKEAHGANIPFVAATGGHSTWSTVRDGLIIDLSSFKSIKIDPEANSVTITGGVLMKELQLALAEQQLFTTIANGNTVGVIPYVIGGGISSYTSMIGYASENILSARIVVANGDVVTASESQNQELLWAIRGAGQFFGVVTEVVLRVYKDQLIGPNGLGQSGAIFFPTERAEEVCQTMKDIVALNEHSSAGHLMVMMDPSHGRMLMAAPQFFGSRSEFETVFKPLLDRGPLMHQAQDLSFATHSDNLEFMCAKGDFKRFSQTGLQSLHPENFAKLVDLHRELLDTVPGTERSAFTVEWHTTTPSEGARKTETAFGLKDVEMWLNIMTWYTDPGLHEQILDFDRRAQAIMRRDTREEAFVAYTNTSRTDPVEHRYKDPKAVERLRRLKSHWDPDGCFTKEFL